MKIYLVGGAVRDQLLGLPVNERDWVVVGTKPANLLKQNYRQVGRDFPVFLHPETNEEYALARTERKSAPGYYGFDCNYSDSVTLEEDLARRDLTINAMALDEQNQVVDPFGGQQDLKDKILRHVSPAFIEDPVRVLRVARFAARFYYLGFRLANETRILMYEMVRKGELDHLVSERVWQEWQKSLKERNPEQFIWTLRSCDALRVILPEIHALFGVPNPYKHHPEIDSGVHSLMALEEAVKLTEEPIIRFAALVHDLGKALSPMVSWPKHHEHEERGVAVIESLCARLRIPNEYRTLAVRVSRFHLLIHRITELRAATIVKTLDHVDAFRRPHLFFALLQACQADAAGRGKTVDYHQAQKWITVLEECAKVDVKTVIAEGFQGHAIKHELQHRRISQVEFIINSWKSNEK
jgi:tRNA nucleotidyltransferase (CCA-adding enzyme)